MLPKEYRLRAPGDFRRVYGRGRSYVDPLLVLYVHRTSARNQRIGFSVSKKLGGAPQRNRVRRRLQEACRNLIQSLKPGFDAVIVARSRASGATFAELHQVVVELFSRAKLMQEAQAAEESPCDERASD